MRFPSLSITIGLPRLDFGETHSILASPTEFRSTRAYARASLGSRRRWWPTAADQYAYLQLMLMPAQIACAICSERGTNSRLSVTSTTCAGRPSALWGKLALGRKGIQIVLVAMPKAASPGVSVTW